MIWVTWRQQRPETLICTAMLALIAALLLKTGLDMLANYRVTGVAACLAHGAHDDACQGIERAFQDRYGGLDGLFSWLNFLPPVFGVVLAAPFVLDLEQGTHRLLWTQSITRARWATIKLGLILIGAVLAPLAVTALMTWWHGPLDRLQGRFSPNSFDFEGTVFVAYTVFAVALVLAAGTLLRRAIPAVAIGLIAFLGVRGLTEGFLRPRYLPPLEWPGRTGTVRGPGALDWIVGSGWRDHLGRAVGSVYAACPAGNDAGQAGFASCLRAHGIVRYVTYQPANRFWAFQGIESAIYLCLAAALLVLTVCWIRYRVD